MQYASNKIHAYEKFPKYGITDRVVNTNDNMQILIDLLPSVGRILLDKNSLTYLDVKNVFFIFNRFLNF